MDFAPRLAVARQLRLFPPRSRLPLEDRGLATQMETA